MRFRLAKHSGRMYKFKMIQNSGNKAEKAEIQSFDVMLVFVSSRELCLLIVFPVIKRVAKTCYFEKKFEFLISHFFGISLLTILVVWRFLRFRRACKTTFLNDLFEVIFRYILIET